MHQSDLYICTKFQVNNFSSLKKNKGLEILRRELFVDVDIYKGSFYASTLGTIKRNSICKYFIIIHTPMIINNK